MRRFEYKICRRCGRRYLWESGGIIATPMDHMDHGLCEKCRTEDSFTFFRKIFGGKKK